LPEVKAVNHYEMPDSTGYDSQWYSQIAIRPHLKDPELAKSVDSLRYRARRILFLWTAWLAGGGNPARVMNAFALQNVICWYLLAFLLFRWFPPVTWGNCARWAAVLFSFGLIFSVKGALLDGPGLLLVGTGMALVEARRPWLGAVIIGAAGMGKDTSVLCGAGLRLPTPGRPRAWLAWLAQVAIVILPLAIWILCLRVWLGRGDDIGTRNFGLPFEGLCEKLEQSVSQLIAGGYPSVVARFDLCVLVGLLAQFFFFAFRQRWHDPWWRIGASYAVLMAFLGNAVWENYPSAAGRVLLPMTLAFNVVVPRERRWLLLLLIGNLGIMASADIFKPPGRESFIVEGSRALRINPATSRAVEAIYDSHRWYPPEKPRWSTWEFFRWNMGDGTVTIRNPQAFTLVAAVKFRFRAVDQRAAIVKQGSRVLWEGMLQPAEVRKVSLGQIELPPGDTVLTFSSDRPAAHPGNGDIRKLTFSLRDLEIDIKGRR
ncbi:MAG TPA: hypothetical protein VGF85_02730, partial [Opitutaceae bacterium]